MSYISQSSTTETEPVADSTRFTARSWLMQFCGLAKQVQNTEGRPYIMDAGTIGNSVIHYVIVPALITDF